MFSVKLNLPQLCTLVNSSHIEQTVLEKLSISFILKHSAHLAKGPVLSCIIRLTSFLFSNYILPLSLSFIYLFFAFSSMNLISTKGMSLPIYLAI